MKIKYCVDKIIYKNLPDKRYIHINGWVFSKDSEEIQMFSVLNGQQIYHKRFSVERPDVHKSIKGRESGLNVVLTLNFPWMTI